MKRLKHNLVSIGIYSLIVMLLLIPFNDCLALSKVLSISLIFGFVLGMLNEIITQLRKLNGEKFENLED